jgi:hypothetical protein
MTMIVRFDKVSTVIRYSGGSIPALILVLFIAASASYAQTDQEIVYSSYFGGSFEEGESINSCDVRGNSWISGAFTLGFGIQISGNAFQSTFNGVVDGVVSVFSLSGELQYSSYLGGSGNDAIRVARFNPSNNGFVVGGGTQSIDFPVSEAAHLEDFQGENDVFITSFDEQGEMLWSTYFGGTGIDRIENLVVDAAGNVYIVGRTDSPSAIATEGAHDTEYSGGFVDGFLAKFDPLGNLLWSTYFGDTGSDFLSEIDISSDGLHIVCAGYTTSENNIATANAWQTEYSGIGDGVLASFNPETGALNWATYYGGPENDEPFSVKCSSTGDIYIAGKTGSDSNISSAGAHQEVRGGMVDNFLASFSLEGALNWGTYVGGSDNEGDEGSLTLQDDFPVLMSFSSSMNGIAEGNPLFEASEEGGSYFAKFNEMGERLWGTYFLSDRPVTLNNFHYIPSSNKFFASARVLDLIPMDDIITPDAQQMSPGGDVDLIFFLIEDNTLSLPDNYALKKLNIYPNPSSGQFKLVLPAHFSPSSELEIFDLTGKKVSSQLIGPTADEIDVSHLNSGAYLLRIVQDKSIYSARLILE